MELVASLETERRGVYAGSVGHVSFEGQLDTCIAIRTMVAKEGKLYLQVRHQYRWYTYLLKYYLRCRRENITLKYALKRDILHTDLLTPET